MQSNTDGFPFPRSGRWPQAAVGQKRQSMRLSEWIYYRDPGGLVMVGIARHHGQIVDQRSGGNLFVERVLGVRHSQSSPDLRRLLIEGQNGFCVIDANSVKPAFKTRRLCSAGATP